MSVLARAVQTTAIVGMLAVLAPAVSGCGVRPEPASTPLPPDRPPATSLPVPSTDTGQPQRTPTSEPLADDPHARPDWLGTRVLPERADGLGEVRETPPELEDRRLAPPAAEPIEDGFVSSVEPVPPEVLSRSTWVDECPVVSDELHYVTMAFRGFDGNTYLGEMIVHASVSEDIVHAFQRIYDADFPIEEMRVIRADELDAPPTGDGNVTTAFVCRPTTLGSSWSEHAYGLAVDVNPFQNPYQRGDAVIPELASAYLDRHDHRPGMIQPGDAATSAFADIGWGWGGEWRSLKDWMHFSQSGR